MSLKLKIQSDLSKSIKEGNKVYVDTLRNVISAITVGEKANGKNLEDSDIIKIFSKLVKDRKTSIEMFEQGGRKDLVEKEQSQIKVLESYLPKAMSTEEITTAIKEIVSLNGYTKADMGKVMKDFNSKYAGQADGKTVSEIVKSLL
jgi:uncharacterized protein YqeY